MLLTEGAKLLTEGAGDRGEMALWEEMLAATARRRRAYVPDIETATLVFNDFSPRMTPTDLVEFILIAWEEIKRVGGGLKAYCDARPGESCENEKVMMFLALYGFQVLVREHFWVGVPKRRHVPRKRGARMPQEACG